METLHTSKGIELISGAAIDEFDTTDREGTGILLADGRRLPADVVVVGIGAAPNIEWLEGAEVNLCDGVWTGALQPGSLAARPPHASAA